jgi:hypothetical protein
MQRPTEREFLLAVLRELDGLPPALVQGLIEATEAREGDRAEALRRLFEEAGRG